MRTSNEKVNSNPHGRMASFDDTLAVFTQFTCLRLNAQRCLVSCFDRNKQYILAEATKSLALATHKSDDPLDELWLGAGIQERNSMLCERTLELAENEKNHGRDPVVMFPDIEDDHWYKASRSHIRQPPDARCYAGVAIRSPFGPVIGVISVLYQDPRHGMSTKDHEFLQHMSSVVMSHLDMVRSKEEHRRTSQMVIALGSFFEGKDRLDDDLSSKDVMASRDLENQQLPPTAPGAAIAGSANTARSEACLSNPDTQDNNSAEDPSAFENLQAQMLSTDVKSTFSRAAHIIKDAVDLDGVVFLDASVGSYGGLVQSVPTHSDDDSTSYFARTSASSKECHVLGHAGHSVPQSSATEGFLHSLLTRYAQGRIFNIDPEEHDLHMTNSDNPEQTEDFGQQVDPAEAQNSSPQAREEVRRQRKADIQHLKRFFPQARSLAFIPLWDDHRGRWFSGCIAWSTQVIRLLHKDSELSFLRAFGIAIMSEVAKLDTAMADKAKSDLLNSISHELRSPLHGILGSIEVLESSSLDSLQHGLVQTVDTCGRTLLDTINHLLDFSKINNFTRKNSKRQKNSEIRQVDMLSLDSQIHVPTITEEALETVFAGHTSFAAHTKTDCEQQSIDSHATRKEEVRLIVDIEAKDYENWLFSTEGGAWKRLVMNLVSVTHLNMPPSSLLIQLHRPATV
jgi:signal transduction histidine kinase